MSLSGLPRGKSFPAEQVAIEIRQAVASGEAQPGEALPTNLAAVLGVDAATFGAALGILAGEGVLVLCDGRATVAARAKAFQAPAPVLVASARRLPAP